MRQINIDAKNTEQLSADEVWKETVEHRFVFFSKLGVAQMMVGRLKDAIDSFEKALELKSDSLDSYKLRTILSHAYLQAGNLEKAAAVGKKILSDGQDFLRKENSDELYQCIYDNVINSSRGWEKEKYLHEAMKKFPNDPNYFFQYGLEKHEQKDYKSARICYDRALTKAMEYKMKNMGALMMANAEVCLIDQDYERSLELYKGALFFEPGYLPAWAGVIKLNILMNKFEPAREACESALEVCSEEDVKLITQMMANIDYQLHNIDKALAGYEEVLKIDPESCCSHKNIGLCYLKKGEIEGDKSKYLAITIQKLKDAINFNPNCPHARESLKLCCQRVGKIEDYNLFVQEMVWGKQSGRKLQYLVDLPEEVKRKLEQKGNNVDLNIISYCGNEEFEQKSSKKGRGVVIRGTIVF
ncbi:MAG: tetratricopeptide repeat protein [Patescibacteria group bacterium]